MFNPTRIYLAGPDVFFPGYDRHKDRMKALCQATDLLALCPADDALVGTMDQSLSARIYAQNIALIDSAELVMANVCNFRGSEPDSGTVFEIGYAIGKGKKVWCYNVPPIALSQQIAHDAAGRDAEGNLVEDFGHARNLMLAHACVQVVGDAEMCIAAIGEWLAAREILA